MDESQLEGGEVWFGLVTIFPGMFRAIAEHGITGRAMREGLLRLDYYNPREFTEDERSVVDDRPYGGGPGMVMKAQPLFAAIRSAKDRVRCDVPKVIYLSPQGSQITQARIAGLAERGCAILVCGRYEGVDERLIEVAVDDEWSIGDYVISGGELAAMVLIDAVLRVSPGALRNSSSLLEESFSGGLLDYPQYTRPRLFRGLEVPQVLLSGDHGKIRRWRLKQSLGCTLMKKPWLLRRESLSHEQLLLLDEFRSDLTSGFGSCAKVRRWKS